MLQGEERRAVEEQSRLVAFDRQNHMGATDKLAKSIKTALQEEAEQILADRTLISGAVTIQEHADRMKVRIAAGREKYHFVEIRILR